MKIQNLQTFCTVISEGNMTVAAGKLAITQPAVSQQICLLEKDLGVKLLSRNSRKVEPTIYGQIVYENANRILNLMQKTKNSIKAMSLNLSGEQINVATVNSIGLHLVSPVIGNFLKLNNKIRLSLLYGTSDTLISRMQKDDLDVVIMSDLRQEYGRNFPQFQKIVLFNDSLYCVASGREQALPNKLSFKDLVKYRLIQVENHYFSFQNYFQQKAREHNISIEPSFRCDNIGTVKRAIESGLGYGFLPAHSIYKQIRLGRLKKIDLEGFNYSVNVNFYYKSSEKKDNIMEILKILIQQQVQTMHL